MASQVCGQCGASVATDEQFCPSCGAFIDPLIQESPARPASSGSGGRPGNVISISPDGNKYEEFSLQEPPAAEPKPSRAAAPRPKGGDSVSCPSCQAPNPAANRHCQQCGARLQQGALPTAPRPAVQATAGVRAAVAISALLLTVVLGAVLFNFFSGDTPPSATTTSTPADSTTTTAGDVANAPVDVLREECNPTGIGSFTCANLTDGNPATEYQIDWENLAASPDGKVEIRLDFPVAMIIDRIEWVNIADETRFQQNYRARGISVKADSNPSAVPFEIPDSSGPHFVDFPAYGAHTVTIEVLSAYTAQVVGNNRWSELAIAEIVIWGRPAPAGS